jgi:O-methyltransferase involved in polyketide biosynthesis
MIEERAMPSAMSLGEDNIPPSALYTAATWRWGKLPGAELVTPPNAGRVFRVVNAYMSLYRVLNPGWHSLKHTLIQRHVGIEHLLRVSNCAQVIEIATGFSPRGCALSADPWIRYFEVDLAPVIDAKRAMLARTPGGREVLQRRNFALLEGDVTAMDWTRFPGRASFIITEGLMMYLERARQLAIWRSIAGFLREHRGEYVFDYLPVPDEPRRSFAGRFLSRLRGAKDHPFPCDGRSREEIADDLRAAGFENITAHSSIDFASAWNLPHAKAHTRVILYRCRCQGVRT